MNYQMHIRAKELAHSIDGSKKSGSAIGVNLLDVATTVFGTFIHGTT
jgi:hypothetical protein